MNIIKKIIPAVMVLALFGCASAAPENNNDDTLSIVTTIFPEYDWVKEVAKGNDDLEITLLLDTGADLHSYQPSASDIRKIADCDLFIYVGGESDEWVKDTLDAGINEDMKVICLMDVLGDSLKEEEIKEGMEEGREHDHEEEAEYDEHVWLSLRNAGVFIEEIRDTLTVIDPEHGDLYAANAEAYSKKIDTLDKTYTDVFAKAHNKTVLFADRFPFRYLFDDYGLDYYAAFPGCSSESSASFETVIFLAGKADELSLSSVAVLENSDQQIAKTVIASTKNQDQETVVLNSLQSVTGDQIGNGITYLSIMEEDLKTLERITK